MKATSLLPLASLLSVLLTAPVLAQEKPKYEFVPNFLTPPPGFTTIGDSHGEIQVDSAGNIYVSVGSHKEGGIEVFTPDGKFSKFLPLPNSLHGFSIRKDDSGEFIYAAVLGQQRVIKATLAGEIVMEIPRASFPQEIADATSLTLKSGRVVTGYGAKKDATSVTMTVMPDRTVETFPISDISSRATVVMAKGNRIEGLDPVITGDTLRLQVNGATKEFKLSEVAMKDDKPAISEKLMEQRNLAITSADCAPNGDIYVVDGYGSDWIFVFNREGKFKKMFGGRVEPFKLVNCHKVHIDNRFETPRVLLCDRANNRLIHATLDGEMIGVVATNLRKPSSASFHGDLMAIAEIAGQVSVWDKEGKCVAALGTNDTPGQTNTPNVAPEDWRDNLTTSPHGITFDGQGNILETEWNKYGRVLRWNRVK